MVISPPDVLIRLNIVPLEPFDGPILETKLSIAPLQPVVPEPDKIAITSAVSPRQIV